MVLARRSATCYIRWFPRQDKSSFRFAIGFNYYKHDVAGEIGRTPFVLDALLLLALPLLLTLQALVALFTERNQ